MRAPRVCSECRTPIEQRAPSAKTCGDRCRDKRRRRLKAAEGQANLIEINAARDIARFDVADAEIRKAVATQLGPIVRDAIDENVMEAVARIVHLTPQAVDVLEAQLSDENPTIQQRAATTVVKYTIGHPALVRPPDEKPAEFVVNIGLPRPDSTEPEVPLSAEHAIIVEYRVCDSCGTEKPDADFVAGSDRCHDCFNKIRREVLAKLT